MADDPNAMLSALTARGGAPAPGENVPLPPPRPKGIDEYADPMEADAEHAMIADQMGGTPDEADLPRGPKGSGPKGISQEEFADILAKGDLRRHLERAILPPSAPPARDMTPDERAIGLMRLKGGMGVPLAQPRSIIDTGAQSTPAPFAGNLGDRRDIYQYRGSVPTPRANALSGEEAFPLHPDGVQTMFGQEDERYRTQRNIMGKDMQPRIEPGLSREPEDVELRQWVANRMGSGQPEPGEQPPQPNVMSFLSRLMSR